MITRMKKSITMVCIALALLTSTANCFGKFSLVRKVYQLNDSINVGGGYVAKAIKTLVFYVFCFFPVYGIASLIDIVVLNLIEFWTGSNPVGLNEFDKNGTYTKVFEKDGTTMQLTYMDFGNKLRVRIFGKSTEEFFLSKDAPGKIFKSTNGNLKEIGINSLSFEEKTIFQITLDGQSDTLKVVDTKEVDKIEKEYLQQL